MDDDDHLSEAEHTISLIIRPHEEHHLLEEARVVISLEKIHLSVEAKKIA